MIFMLVAAFATFFNFCIIIWKFKKERFLDSALDLSIFAIIAVLFAGTITGLQIGMVASMLVSLYLLAFPPKIQF